MKDVAYILFGAAFTIAVAYRLGGLLLRFLRVALGRDEAALFAFLSGAALLSLVTFFLCALQLAYKGVFLAGGILVLVVGQAFRPVPLRTPRGSAAAEPKAGPPWYLLFYVILATFFILYFFNALAPEVSPDGSGYHLANVARIWRHHGFVWDFHSLYAYFPQGTEMLFLVAFVFGHASAAALVHLMFLVSLALLMICWGRRYEFPLVGWFAAVLVFVSPVAGKAGSSAYNDLAVAAAAFAVFYLLQVWDEDRPTGLLILIGLLAGFSYSMKYSAVLVLPYAAGYLWWRLRGGNGTWRGMAIFAGAAGVMVLPWLLRNWIWLGNPVSPLLNRWFPNPYYQAGMEQSYLADVRHYEGLQHWWQIPWRHLVSGELVGGVVGPIFLLTPLALLALRRSSGRRLLLAGLVFGLPALMNAQTRFLLPALPFVSLALGEALAKPRALLPVIALAHGIAGVPAVVALYSNRYNWHIESLPVAAALRLVPEPDFLAQHIPDYPLKYTLERTTPPDARFFTWTVEESAYINRDLSPSYESARGNIAIEWLSIPLIVEQQPSMSVHFRFPPLTTRHLRLVETAKGGGYWTIAEFHISSQGSEVVRSPDWKVDASPDPGEAGFAFDHNDVSRWSSWQSLTPGMFLAVDFGRPHAIDEVECVMAPHPDAQMHLEVRSGRGEWTAVAATIERTTSTVPPDIRRQATQGLKSLGITHLILRNTDLPAADIRNNADLWGLQQVGEVGPLHIYRLEY